MANIKLEEAVIPDGYKLVKDDVTTAAERRIEEIAKIQELLAITPEPTDEELINFAKATHLYYQHIRMLNALNKSFV